MPSIDSDSDLNHYARTPHQPNSYSTGYDASSQLMGGSLNTASTPILDDSLSLLPAYTYNQPPANRPSLSTFLEERAVSANGNGYNPDPRREDDSPDPDDFYRRYQYPLGRSSAEGLAQSEIVIAKRGDDTMTPRRQAKTSAVPVRMSASKLPPLSSRVHTAYGSRNQSSSSTENSPVAAAKATAALVSSATRNRQTSLKDLVDRFNQTPDEVPPLPRKSTSRSTSTNSNPQTGAGYTRARTSSQSKPSGAASAVKDETSRQEQTGKPIRLHQRRGRKSEDMDMSPIPGAPDLGPPLVRRERNAHSSQSMTNLKPGHGTVTRKLLFGEVLAVDPGEADAGYGIPLSRRRRGSEGSMHSPNPMFPDERNIPTRSPSSPSAWYLGVTPTLEEIKMERAIPHLPPQLHRRTRSDFTGITPRPPLTTHLTLPVPRLSSHPAPPPLSPASPRTALSSSPTSSRAYKRDSQSRIPISARRLSLNSDSGNSTPSTRTNSVLGRHPGQPMAPKGSIARPKTGYKNQSPVHTPRPASSRSSHRPGDYSPRQRPATSPRLAAYISAPLPKKSPPLRSSRPRLPVSSASTSASRARAVERPADRDNAIPRNNKDQRSKRPPELGGVDFAARRQKIQQAFTTTVKENERQQVEAEKRRRSVVQGGHLLTERSDQEPEAAILPPPPDPPNGLVLPPESRIDVEEEHFQTPSEELPKSERELTIQTGNLPDVSVLDLSQEDSPTLGGFSRFTTVNRGSVEPSSAVTASTSDSVDTFFENEAQEDSPDSFQEHRTLLNHIMSMRDTSSTSPVSIQVADESNSEKDDRESIKIMLGDTPVLEKAPYDEVLHDKPKEAAPYEEPGSRWSMSSWTSSTRSKDRSTIDQEKEAPMQRIDEHFPIQQIDTAHLSVSTASTNQTPQPWSPATFSSVPTHRTTMDSDTYSTINRVLDHYHDPSIVPPEFMSNVQQHIITQSPDLARQGGWDPKRVTPLYLQELARNGYARSSAISNSLKPQTRQPTGSVAPTSAPKPKTNDVRHEEPSGMIGTLEQGSEEQTGTESTPSAVRLEVDESEFKLHRASLNAPADWDMSPSISDWIHLQAVDSPLDDIPVLASSSWQTGERKEMDGKVDDDLQPSKIPTDSRPELPEIRSTGEGLGIGGLAINVTEPQDDDSPTIQPPPLPNHLPPPPPIDVADEDYSTRIQITSPSSIYSKRVLSSTFPTTIHADDENRSVPASSEEAHPPPVPALSAEPSISSSTAQGRLNTEMPSAAPETATNVPASPEQKRLTRRKHIIKELVDTEHSFGQDMKVVDDIYRGTSGVVIMAEDVKTLFGNSDQIVVFSTNFLDALKQAAKGVYTLPKSKRWRSNRTSNATSYSGNSDDQSSISGGELTDDEKDRKTFVGEAFGHHMASMEKVYAEYLRNQGAANQKLQALQKNQKVQVWLNQCLAYAHDLTKAWNLDALLVKPLQRILKYPLFLQDLLDVTPENHPDFTYLDAAVREMKGISMRINEMKKRAEVMEQVGNRKRKESDVRLGLSKAFGRRTEKLRQQVGLSDSVEDKGYAAVSERFGSHFFQLQVVMRDVEMYTGDVQLFMNRFSDFILAIEAHVDVGQTSYPELESKWRKFRMSTREMSMTALTDHVNAVRKNVIEPMTTLLKLHDGPQKLMQKRNKRVPDYARFKAIKDRGEKPDKKLVEQGEQFMAINDTLKEDLPKLFSTTGKLVEACLNNFVQLQLQWYIIWRRKLSQAIDDCKIPTQISDIVDSFAGDFAFFEAQVLSLGICNGSMLADAVNLVNVLSPTVTFSGDGTASPGQASSLDLAKRRTLSISSDKSPMLPQPDFGMRNLGVDNGLPLVSGVYAPPNHVDQSRRVRASSAVSSQGPRTPEIPGAYRSYFNSNGSISSAARPITTISRTTTEPTSVPRPSFETSSTSRASDAPTFATRPPSGSPNPPARSRPTSESTYPPTALDRPVSDSPYPPVVQRNTEENSSPTSRFSGFFSSAMPMSDSPLTDSPTEAQGRNHLRVLFLAASVYEFNIDRARREAGYPYLTYVAGEIFDVIGEKGELWLAKNQDDATNLVGWIWNKHFVKLAS